MLLRLEEIVKDLLAKWNCRCIEINGEKDHLHLLFQYTPQIQLSKLVPGVNYPLMRGKNWFAESLRELLETKTP